jgi:hypothetical protein
MQDGIRHELRRHGAASAAVHPPQAPRLVEEADQAFVMDGGHRPKTVVGGISEAEVVVGEQRGTDRLDPRRHLVHGDRNAVLDFGHGVMQNVAGVVDDTHFRSPLLGLGWRAARR